jgi:starch synthase
MDGLLRHRQDRLSGILNGIDTHIWDPNHDRLIPASYSTDKMLGKSINKAALQRHFGLPEIEVPVFGLVSRLVEQKGIDLLLAALPDHIHTPIQLVILGSGNKHYEQACLELVNRYPHQVGVTIGYDEALAHLIEAGADFFLMPSRFEPCGLNQLYSLRYGTPPIVHKTGGLADTVTHTWSETLGNGSATGFVFEHPTATGLSWAMGEALRCMASKDCLPQLRQNGMRQDVSWENSAQAYRNVYRQAQQDKATA